MELSMRRILTSLIFAALVVVISPSAHARVLSSDKWTEYRGQNFVIISDGKAEHVRGLIRDLEHFRFVVMNLLGVSAKVDEKPLTIIAFRNSRDFYKSIGSRYVGGYLTTGLHGQYAAIDMSERYVVKAGRKDLAGRVILYHEYVHYLMRLNTGFSYPYWYDEGFAEYLATYTYEGTEINIGRPHYGRVRTMSFLNGISGEALLSEGRRKIQGHGSEFYAQSWLLVHMLHSEPYARHLPTYLSRWNAGERGPALFEEVFGIKASRLKKRIRNYWKSNSYDGIKLTLDKPYEPPVPVERSLSALETMETLGELFWGRRTKFSTQLYEYALRLDPSSSKAKVGLGYNYAVRGRLADAQAKLDAVPEQHRDTLRYFMAKGEVLFAEAALAYEKDQDLWARKRDAARDAYIKALQIDNTFLPAWLGLGVTCLGVDDFQNEARMAFGELGYYAPEGHFAFWLYIIHLVEDGRVDEARQQSEKLIRKWDGAKDGPDMKPLERLVAGDTPQAAELVDIVWRYYKKVNQEAVEETED